MTALGPFRRLACLREDLIVIPFDHIHHTALDYHNLMVKRGCHHPNDPAAYAASIGSAFHAMLRSAKEKGKDVVTYYSDDDLHDAKYDQRLIYRLKGGVQLRYYTTSLVVEAEGKIHVLKDRKLTLKPLITAIRNEAPEMIGATIYAHLDRENATPDHLNIYGNI